MFAMNVPFKKMVSCATIPTHGHDILDAGLDFYSAENFIIMAHESASVDTGVAWDGTALCTDYEMPVLIMKSRSGLAFKLSVEASNAGVIDCAFRGSIKVLLHNNSDEDLIVNVGDRIAQGIVFMVPYVQPIEVEDLSETSRGENGFGSTGVK